MKEEGAQEKEKGAQGKEKRAVPPTPTPTLVKLIASVSGIGLLAVALFISAPLVPASCSTPSATPPIAPSEFTGTVIGKKVVLSWTDRSPNEDGFLLERSEAQGRFVEIARTGPNVTTWTDDSTKIKSDISYKYRIHAFNSKGQSIDAYETNITPSKAQEEHPPDPPTPPDPPKPEEQKTLPPVQIGDRWIYSTIDHQSPQWSNTTERIVREVTSSHILVTSRNTKSNYVRTLEYDLEWNFISSRERQGNTKTYSPALAYFSFPLTPGKTWQRESIESAPGNSSQKTHRASGKVEQWEQITVPAGTFKAIKVVLIDEVFENGELVHRGQDISWFVPEVKRSVKTDETSLSVASGETSSKTIELIEYSVSH